MKRTAKNILATLRKHGLAIALAIATALMGAIAMGKANRTSRVYV